MRVLVFVVTSALFVASTANAGPYTDDLSKCLVESTSPEDRTALVRWMFAAMAQHPAVTPLASVSPEKVEESNAAIGKLFMRLLTRSCDDKAKKALQYEGSIAMNQSFTVLGQVAASEIFANPKVTEVMSGLDKYVDKKKLESLNAK